MKKRKVISFFVVLFMFVVVLAFLQVARFGSLTGFSVNKNAELVENSSGNQNVMGFFVLVFALIIITGFTAKLMRRRNERHIMQSEKSQRRKLIPLEF